MFASSTNGRSSSDGGGHARRETTCSPHHPENVLRKQPVGTSDYKLVLGALLKKFNHQHSAKHKGVSNKTMHNREVFLVGFFTDLRKNTIYRDVDPRQLANRHVQAAVDRWQERGLSTGTIHSYLSMLRTYGEWIGKPAMVRHVSYYVGTDSKHAKRHQVATFDHSWSAKAVAFDAKLPEIAAFDMWVGFQIELCYRFGMRPKEARHFRPHGAVIPREMAIERDAEAFPEHQTFLHIANGTKGGRPRDVPISTAAQRELLARLTAAVPPGGYIAHPGRTTVQNQRRFYHVLSRFGITKAELGVVAHGLRHQFVNDTFEAETGSPSPVRGGLAAPAGDKEARQRAARLLGHGRRRVTSCYLGTPERGAGVTRGPKPPAPETDPDSDAS